MNKIGVISVFEKNHSNYGNILQTYALNYYLRQSFPKYQVESLYFGGNDLLKYNFCLTKETMVHICPEVMRVLKNRVNRRLDRNKKEIEKILETRKERCNQFSEQNIQLPSNHLSGKELESSEYEILFVGSDVVWLQKRFAMSKIRFLDLDFNHKVHKVAYAASFGRDFIPAENVGEIIRCLNDFNKISLRESSSVKMLSDMEIPNVTHVVDPTLLLRKEDWQQVEKKPENFEETKYVFSYLLGESGEEREEISKFAQARGLKLVSIPYASEHYNEFDEEYADIKMTDCSPEEWIWLIHNAEYVITDSFHGTVFATIFHKKFICLSRKYLVDLNNRIFDYLSQLHQVDKLIDIKKIDIIQSFHWNYSEISNIQSKWRTDSVEFINEAMEAV